MMQSQSVTPGDHHFAFHDTREHKLTCCSNYDSIRGSFSALFPDWETYPKCFQMHGIVPDKPWLPLVWEAHDSATIQVDGFPVQRNGNYAALLHRWNGCRSLQPRRVSCCMVRRGRCARTIILGTSAGYTTDGATSGSICSTQRHALDRRF